MLRQVVSTSFLVALVACTAPSTFFSEEDGTKLANFIQSQSLSDSKSIFEAARAFQLLGRDLPNKSELCSAVKTLNENNLAQSFYAYSASGLLGCDDIKPTSSLVEKVVDAVDESEDLDILAFAVPLYVKFAESKHLKIKKDSLQAAVAHIADLQSQRGTFKHSSDSDRATYEAAAEAWSVLALATTKAKMDDDDLLSILTASEAVPQLLKAADSDPVGPLAITDRSSSSSALLLTSQVAVAIKDLASALSLDLDVTPAQINRLASYLLSQKNAYQTVAEAHALISGLSALAGNTIATPLAVTLQPSALQQTGSSILTVGVSDIFGKQIGPAKVNVNRATLRGSVSSSISNQLANAKDESGGEYTINFPKSDAGLYDLDISVVPSNNQYAAVSTTRNLKVTTSTSVSATIGVKSGKFDGEPEKLNEGEKLQEVLVVSSQQQLTVVLDVKSATTNKAFKPHQTFALFQREDGSEVYFAFKTNNKQLSLTLNLAEVGADFDFKGGKYSLSLLIGDANILNPVFWDVGFVDLAFPTPKAIASSSTEMSYEPLPVINHVFRQPERRPSLTVSSTFTALIGVPAAILLISLLRIGFNFSGYPGGAGALSTLVFVGLLGSLVALIAGYWFFLSIFQTLKALAVLLPVTAVVGTHALTAIQTTRLKV